jgi:CheY-like chemotaxis protein
MVPAGVAPTTVFLIEDDDDIRESLVEVLEEAGLSISWAPNGRLALDRLRAAPPPDVIVLDLMMPVMDGWEFRQEQLNDDRLKHIPAIIATATLIDQQMARERLGNVVYFSKPFNPAKLIDAIKRVGSRRP